MTIRTSSLSFLAFLAGLMLASCGVLGNKDPAPAPTAAFTAGCLTIVDSLVSFSNGSKNASRYHWSFGNGDSSSARTPAITYRDTGTYNVLLVVENADGVRDSISHSIHIASHPLPATLLDVKLVQEANYTLWWAAPIEMLFRYNGMNVDQCAIARARLNHDCCSQPNGCDLGTSVDDVRDAIYRSGGMESEVQYGPMDIADIRKEVTQGRPVIAAFSDGTYAYMYLIYGYDSTDNIYCHDPAFGSFVAPYLSFVSLRGYSWSYSIYCARKE